MGNTSTKPAAHQTNCGARTVPESTGRRVSSSIGVNGANYSVPPPSYDELQPTLHRRVLYPSAPLECGPPRVLYPSAPWECGPPRPPKPNSNSNNAIFTGTNNVENSNKLLLKNDNGTISVKYQTQTEAVLNKELDIPYLLELSHKTTPDIVKVLKENMRSLEDLFQKPITQSLLSILIRIVKKICMCDQLDDKIQILKIVCCDNFFDILGNYISDLPTHTGNEAKEDWLFLMEGVLPFFECIVLLIPHHVSLKLRELIIKTKLSIHGIEQYQKLKMSDESKSRLKKLESLVGFEFVSKDEKLKKSDQSSSRPMGLEHTSDSILNPTNFNALCNNNVPGVQKSLLFIERVNNKQESVNNAEFFIAFALYLIKQKYSANDIIMITTSEVDFSVLLALKRRSPTLEKMTVQMITDQDKLSASIVLLFFSLNEDRSSSMLNTNLLHRIFLGAKEGLYMIGNMEYLTKMYPFWCSVKKILQKYEAISTNLALCCQTHKLLSYVNTVHDFKDLQNGGCSLICNKMLPCGHQCVRRCHSQDLKHRKYTCHKPCTRNPENCTRNHPCPKLCYEKCGLCQASVVLSGVAHICFEVSHPNQNVIKNPVSHESMEFKGYGRPHTRQRGTSPHPRNKDKSQHYQKKSTKLPCGHFSSQKVQLSEKLDQWSLEHVNLCQFPCSETLKCGHKCSGTCGKCRQGRVHITCCETKKIRLACGHRHIVSCNDGVWNCEQKCFNECSHLRCREKCGTLCTVCNQTCASKCIHSRCTKKCYEPCDRLPCRKPCQELLICGHPCVGFCGEPCPPGPENCRICNPEKFKRSDSSGFARFVLLEDCNHVVRANELDKKIFGRNFKLEGLQCPICHYNIVKTGRYLNYNKELHFKLNEVRNRYIEYCSELKKTFRNIIIEIKENNLPLEIEKNSIINEVKDHLKRAVDLQNIDRKSIILLHFVRNILCSIGTPPYTSMQWMMILLLERYDSGFSPQVLNELYGVLIEYQRINGQIHRKKVMDLREAISFFHLLEKDTWFKCTKDHIVPCNSLLTPCYLCDDTF